MIKTLTQYPGVVQHLLTRAAHRPPPSPRKIYHRPVTLPGHIQPTRHRESIRRQIASVADAHPAHPFAPTFHCARMQWFHPTPEEQRRSQLRAFILTTALPLALILATAFAAGCLTAIMETFTP